MRNRQQRAVLITGASEGLGKSLAKLLSESRRVVIAVGRNKDKLDELKKHSDRIVTIPADISKESDRKKITNLIKEHALEIDVIHNAAIASALPLSEITHDQLTKVVETNCIAIVLLNNLLLPFLQAGGRSLLVTSGLASFAMPGLGMYSMSKAALNIYHEYFNVEITPLYGCLSALVNPGIMDTRMQERLRQDEQFVSRLQFQAFKEKNQLRLTGEVADFLGWILNFTQDEIYSSKWDMDKPPLEYVEYCKERAKYSGKKKIVKSIFEGDPSSLIAETKSTSPQDSTLIIPIKSKL